MKQVIILGIVVLVAFLLVSTAHGAITIIKGVDFARVGIGDSEVVISRVVDGEVTCYVSRQGKFGVHSLSCVK